MLVLVLVPVLVLVDVVEQVFGDQYQVLIVGLSPGFAFVAT